MSISACPLQWPMGWKRATSRKAASFNTKDRSGRTNELSVADGVGRVLVVLAVMGYSRDDIVISTNVPTRLDGLPRAGLGEPGDPGAAVYWRTHSGTNKVMAIDRYDRVADNLAAIAASLEAMRAIERHGGAAILDRAFTGFTALPAPSSPDWADVLGVARTADTETIRAAYRRMAAQNHPDRGGDPARMAAINAAYEEATS